ncbi:MAG: polysaccharide biosynthesis protein [Xanthomonadales bacterium]|nr:polysaccharide biosynthesis protein [Xanthomonadales bacterium]
MRVGAAIALARSAIERHGGGWRGAWAVARRSARILHALGWRGLAQRIRAASAPPAPAMPQAQAVHFPPASPLDQVRLRVGVMLHVFYPDLLDELARDLAHMPVPYVLMISVGDATARDAALARCRNLPRVQTLEVRIVPNRGRDLAPLLLTFRGEILALDVVCHLHTKKSLYSGQEQDRWRRYLVERLLGSGGRIGWILGMFQAMPQLGMVYPESFASVPWWAHTWLSNVACGRELGARLGIAVDPAAYLDYPAGSMFWARTAALRPLYDLELPLATFPPEQGQTDGTTQHALERLLGLVVPRHGMLLGILPADGTQSLHGEGERNWHAYFSAPLAHKIGMAALDAELVSFDVFDTLVWRPFLQPAGARAYLGWLVERRHGLAGFDALRSRAEHATYLRRGCDVTLADIYAELARRPELRGMPMAALQALEMDTEQRLLRPRPAAVDAARTLAEGGKRVIAVSDMYLAAEDLRHVLPSAASEPLRAIHVSCDNGWRKDGGAAWRQLPELEGVRPEHWLHVGDNEHADVQLPQAMGFIHPVHALRSGALLDLVPALRPLRPSAAQRGRWQDQLWLGLLANHCNALADAHPEAFGTRLTLEAPEALGYLVLGPLLLDYATWMARLAGEREVRRILFLSREGHLLLQVFQRLQHAVPRLAAIDAGYFLASRRAVHTAALRSIEDLHAVFAAPYTGPLDALIRARLGAPMATALATQMARATLDQEVFLPEMQTQLIELLRPFAATITKVARTERETYLEYCSNMGVDEATMVADIGYAASIQHGLMRLTGQPLGGAYLALKAAADQVTAQHGWACARFHDARTAGTGEAGPVMRHHLLLEAMLTAPQGQFSHFSRKAGALDPVYATNGMPPADWRVLERVHAGCLRFVDDACDVVGADAVELAFDRDHVQVPLQCCASGAWQPGSWARALGVEDRYSGRGVVAGAALRPR